MNPAAVPGLAAGEVHVWRFALDGAWPEVGRTLALVEHERAARFVFERDRTRYMRGRQAMRALLGAYLRTDPARVEIRTGEHGKPYVDAAHGLGFNLSHAGDEAIAAFSRSPDVGIDIERVQPRGDLAALAATVFTDAECAELAAVPDAQRLEAFLSGWTRKEACLKAVGFGLMLEPRGVQVGLDEARNSIEVTASGRVRTVEVERIDAGTGTLAALAVADGYTRYRMLHWTP